MVPAPGPCGLALVSFFALGRVLFHLDVVSSLSCGCSRTGGRVHVDSGLRPFCPARFCRRFGAEGFRGIDMLDSAGPAPSIITSPLASVDESCLAVRVLSGSFLARFSWFRAPTWARYRVCETPDDVSACP